MTTHLLTDARVLPCPWCGVQIERVERGGHVRRFCPGTNHRNLYNSAMRKAALWYADLIACPGALKEWGESKACTRSKARQGTVNSINVNSITRIEDGH